MQGADRGGEEKGDDDGGADGPAGALFDELGHDHAAEAGDEPCGEVDLAQQQDEDLGHGQQHVHRALDEEVDQVPGREELGVERLEQDGDDEKPADDREGAGVPATDAQDPGADVLAEALSDELGGGDEGGLVDRRHVELLDLADLRILRSRHRPDPLTGGSKPRWS